MVGFCERIASGRLLVADGAMGTMLQGRGLPVGACPELWNLQHPGQVRAVHEEYVGAGAELVLTNSFGGNPLRLERFGLGADCAEVNASAVRLAREAANGRAYVFVSVGPLGELLAPYGEVSVEQAQQAFSQQIRAAVRLEPDGIWIETMSSLEEALSALDGAREACNLPVAVCLTFERGPRGYATVMGITPAQAVERLCGEGVQAIGANCSLEMADMAGIVRQMKEAAPEVCVIAKPNAGQPRVVAGAVTYPSDPGGMAAGAREIVKAGAGIVGGCCGSTPQHISALRKAVVLDGGL